MRGEEVERWVRARELLKAEKDSRSEEMEDEDHNKWEDLPPTQHVKVRVRRDSEDSFGSDLTCSLPSSPAQKSVSPPHSPSPGSQTDPTLLLESPPDMIPSSQPPCDRSNLNSTKRMKRRRISWDLQESLQDGEEANMKELSRKSDPSYGSETLETGEGQKCDDASSLSKNECHHYVLFIFE